MKPRGIEELLTPDQLAAFDVAVTEALKKHQATVPEELRGLVGQAVQSTLRSTYGQVVRDGVALAVFNGDLAREVRDHPPPMFIKAMRVHAHAMKSIAAAYEAAADTLEQWVPPPPEKTVA
jgi:hypothetical protein